MSFHKPLVYPTAHNERGHRRHIASVSARARKLGSPSIAATITDLSAGGCRLTGAVLRQDDEIWITFGGSRAVRGRIAWVKAGEAGCEFHVQLNSSELRKALLNRFGSAAEAKPHKASYAPILSGGETQAGPKLKILGVAPRR